ncbi:MAG TPA: hypothetical protein VI749_08990 [Candidatus Omnitrophota bacterium]|nr:hypothetical protein [Candidatus Omnitrophota bacterium]
MFAQGDHGRDLYAFSMTAKGAIPYRDYHWQYGPLMPYYYALFFKGLGVSILSVLFAETLLKFFCGLTVFFIIRHFSNPFWSFLSTISFWGFFPYFSHTYSHTGGILLLFLAAFTLIKYIYTSKTYFLYIGVFTVFLLSFVKINFSICAWGSYILCVLIINKHNGIAFKNKKNFYGVSLILLPLLTILIYYYLINGLPDYVIKQCFPHTKTGGPFSIELSQSISKPLKILWLLATRTPRNGVFLILFLLSLLAFLIRQKKINPQERKCVNITLICLTLFFFTHLHEFMLSANADYRYRIIWALPFLVLTFFVLLTQTLKTFPKTLNIIVAVVLLAVILKKVDYNFKIMESSAHPSHFLGVERAGVLLGNSPEWINTVQKTVWILNRELEENELFFAFPFEPLFYYLLDRTSPSHQIMFFDFMESPPQQDAQTVQDLENKKIRWAVSSNRIISSEESHGTFGKTNSPQLARYLEKNFKLMWELGRWDRVPGWNTNYGIRILKRAAQ